MVIRDAMLRGDVALDSITNEPLQDDRRAPHGLSFRGRLNGNMLTVAQALDPQVLIVSPDAPASALRDAVDRQPNVTHLLAVDPGGSTAALACDASLGLTDRPLAEVEGLRAVPRVARGTSLREAWQTFQEGTPPVLAVTDASGRVLGAVTRDSTTRALLERLESTEAADSSIGLEEVDLFDNPAIATTLLDASGRICDINAEVERLTDFSSAQLIGKSIVDVMPEGEREHFEAAIRRCREGGAARNVRTQRLKRSGETVPVVCQLTRLGGVEDACLGMVLTDMEITHFESFASGVQGPAALSALHRDLIWETNRVETLDEAAFRVLRSVLHQEPWAWGQVYLQDEQAPDSLVLSYEAGPNGNEFASYRGAVRMPMPPVLTTLAQRVRETQRPAQAHHDDAIETPPKAVGLDIQAVAAFPILVGDEWVGVLICYAAAPVESGQVDLMATIGFPLGRIIERERAERALREREMRLFQITEHLNDVVWLYDLNLRRLIHCNRAYETVWGGQLKHLYQHPSAWLDRIHPADRDAVVAAYKRSRQGTAQEQEYRVLGSDGEIKWIRDRSFPIFDEAGRVCRIAGIAEDVSDRRRLEREVATATLREQRRISRDLHDGLCAQLAGIALFASTAHRRLERDGSPEAGRLAQMVQDLQDAQREARDVCHGLSPVWDAPDGLMQALRRLVEKQARGEGLDIRFHCEHKVELTDTSVADHLFLIAQEAVQNAIRHGRPSEVAVRLGRAEAELELVVEDNGSGFSGIPDSSDGLGMLSMRHRARLIGAELSVSSTPGQGTKVRCKVAVS